MAKIPYMEIGFAVARTGERWLWRVPMTFKCIGAAVFSVARTCDSVGISRSMRDALCDKLHNGFMVCLKRITDIETVREMTLGCHEAKRMLDDMRDDMLGRKDG